MCNFVLNMDVDLLIFAAPQAIPTLSLCRSRLDCCTKHAGPVQPSQATAHCPYSMTDCSRNRGKTNFNSVLVFFSGRDLPEVAFCVRSSAHNIQHLLERKNMNIRPVINLIENCSYNKSLS